MTDRPQSDSSRAIAPTPTIRKSPGAIRLQHDANTTWPRAPARCCVHELTGDKGPWNVRPRMDEEIDLTPEQLDARLSWPPGCVQQLAGQRQLRHVLLPEGLLRFIG